jgi:hypothetical protein
MLDSAETFADVMFYLGIVISLVAIAAGIALAVRTFFHPGPQFVPIPEE